MPTFPTAEVLYLVTVPLVTVDQACMPMDATEFLLWRARQRLGERPARVTVSDIANMPAVVPEFSQPRLS